VVAKQVPFLQENKSAQKHRSIGSKIPHHHPVFQLCVHFQMQMSARALFKISRGREEEKTIQFFTLLLINNFNTFSSFFAMYLPFHPDGNHHDDNNDNKVLLLLRQ